MKNNILAPEMTMGLPRVMLDGASGNLVVRATLTVLHPTLNTPNKQIYCKTNGFFMISRSSWEVDGDSLLLLGTPLRLF